VTSLFKAVFPRHDIFVVKCLCAAHVKHPSTKHISKTTVILDPCDTLTSDCILNSG